ncbi:MAG: hydrogenase expression/formation protein HypE [Pirellulales bacterium]|nr:hydrogenase expression/formation protein HypE [Pirellulales bacterium]
MIHSLEAHACPVPDSGDSATITLAHGEGGRLMRRLIREHILTSIGNEFLTVLGDAAILPPLAGPLALSTDSFVVTPLFFPGGDIGSLAVYGTVNDIAVAGAVPRWMSLAWIIEEGLPVGTLIRVLASIADAAARTGVRVVTGDTKVVPRGTADLLYLNTTGVGEFIHAPPPGPAALVPGDRILVSGPIGRHGMAVMTCREGLAFQPPPTSDSAPLMDAVAALREANLPIRAIRDATRGGVAAVLHEWAEMSHRTLSIDENRLPVTPAVFGACEVLGLDPLFVANEGTMVVATTQESASDVLEVLHSVPETDQATVIGEVTDRAIAPVVVRRSLGRPMPLDEPLGAPLPRIC